MRRLLSLLAVSTLMAQSSVTMPETPLSAGDREQAQRLLVESRQGLLKAIDGLTSAQWTFKPASERWSIQECAEHVVTMEQVVQGQVISKGLSSPRVPLRRLEVKVTDGFILAAMPDRSHRVQAPEPFAPKGRWTTQEAAVKAFMGCRQALESEVASTQLDWRTRFGSHPVFGTLDLYQWVLFTAGHTARHTQQIEDVKRSAGYPTHTP
jgi:hypothetical protein